MKDNTLQIQVGLKARVVTHILGVNKETNRLKTGEQKTKHNLTRQTQSNWPKRNMGFKMYSQGVCVNLLGLTFHFSFLGKKNSCESLNINQTLMYCNKTGTYKKKNSCDLNCLKGRSDHKCHLAQGRAREINTSLARIPHALFSGSAQPGLSTCFFI